MSKTNEYSYQHMPISQQTSSERLLQISCSRLVWELLMGPSSERNFLLFEAQCSYNLSFAESCIWKKGLLASGLLDSRIIYLILGKMKIWLWQTFERNFLAILYGVFTIKFQSLKIQGFYSTSKVHLLNTSYLKKQIDTQTNKFQ